MSLPDGTSDPDFDTQLRGLFQQAEQNLEGRVASTRRAEDEKESAKPAEERAARAYLSLPQMLRPMVLGLEALSRAAGENSQMLGKLDTKVERASGNLSEANKSLPALVERLEDLVEQRHGVSQRMFDALHEELKVYKDRFVMESVHKPIIRDLIALYDDLTAIHRQMRETVATATEPETATGGMLLKGMKTMEMNIEHNCGFLVEVLARLDVALMPPGAERYDRHTQRAVAIEAAAQPEADGEIARTVKRGFLWGSRVFRAEEIVLRRWKAPAPAAEEHSQKEESPTLGT